MLTQAPAVKESSVLFLQPLACVQTSAFPFLPGPAWSLQQRLVLAGPWTAFGTTSFGTADASKDPCLKVFNWNHSFLVSLS